jgi:hypothetical protein
LGKPSPQTGHRTHWQIIRLRGWAALLVLAAALGGCYSVGIYTEGGITKVTGRGGGPAFRRLVIAARAPSVPNLDQRRLGVNQTELHAAALRYAERYPPGAARKFADRIAAPVRQRHLLEKIFAAVLHDAGADVRVLLWTGRGPIRLSSSTHHPFMLPWRVRRGGRSYQTWDPEVGRALAALLPAEVRGLFNGASLIEDLLELESTEPELASDSEAERRGD